MTHADKTRKDAKRQRRQVAIAHKREEQHRREAERHRRTLLTYGGAIGTVVVVVALVVVANLRGRSGLMEVPGGQRGTNPTPGAGTPTVGVSPAGAVRGVVERFGDQGGTHIQLGQPHPAYNSNPPTSGWHTPQTANWGALRNAIPDEVIVHNLEHGGIWISYRDPNDAALVEKLETLTARYRSKVILTPRPRNDAPIAVAAWTRMMKLEAYDEEKIVRFIDAFKNKGPERVPD